MLGAHRIMFHRTDHSTGWFLISLKSMEVLVEPGKGSNYEPIDNTDVGHFLGGLGIVNDQLFIFGEYGRIFF